METGASGRWSSSAVSCAVWAICTRESCAGGVYNRDFPPLPPAMQAPYPQPYQYPNAGFYPPPLPPGVGPMTPGTPMYPPMPPQRPPQPRPPSSPPPPLKPRDKRAVTPVTARQALLRLVALQLQSAGFDSTTSSVMDTLSHETEACTRACILPGLVLTLLCSHGNDCKARTRLRKPGVAFARQCSRHVRGRMRVQRPRGRRPAPHEQEAQTRCVVQHNARHVVQHRPGKTRPTALVTPKSRSPSPELLGSDEEGATPHVPMTLRWNPPHLPKLPPKHTYLRTAVRCIPRYALPCLLNLFARQPPPAKQRTAASSALERKLANASLVQESLRNLIESTEDKEVFGRDGDILGGVVNWEAHVHAGYKKWKVS